MYQLWVIKKGVQMWYNKEHGMTREQPATPFKSIEDCRVKAFELMSGDLYQFFVKDCETGETLQRI